MRTPLVVANWKMHKTVREALAFAVDFRQRVADRRDVDIVVAPSFTALHAVAGAFVDTPVRVAGQNLHPEPHGAFTGEVSAGMLKEAGATFVIIGHSERRQLFGDTDEAVKAKVRAAVGAELIPIVCVGETLAEREADQTFAVLDRQLEAGLNGLSSTQARGLVVAYEPVWAIGTGQNATPAQAQEAHARIRQRLGSIIGDTAAKRCRILYGGSVKPANIASLAEQSDVDGALIGGASLDAASFAQIVAKNAGTAV